jgi:AI-2 transport protein TqsA
MAITLVITIAVVSAFGYMVFWGFGKAVQWLIANAARFQALYDETAEWLESHGLYTAGMLAESYNVRWLILTVQRVAANVQSVIIFAALVFVL